MFLYILRFEKQISTCLSVTFKSGASDGIHLHVSMVLRIRQNCMQACNEIF